MVTLNDFLKQFPSEERASSEANQWVYEQVLRLKNELGRPPLCIEVGVFCGWTAIPAVLAGGRIICVDVFNSPDRWIQSLVVGLGGKTLERFIGNLFTFEVSNKVVTIVSESEKAAALFPNDIADFIFIDADHDHDPFAADLTAWGPKVRIGGMIAGHDFNQGPVSSAVHELCTPPMWGPVSEAIDCVWHCVRSA